jgi:hypothetical protein
MIAGECGSPIKRDSWETVISVVDGTGVLLKKGEEKDAILGLPPHEAIAKNPLRPMHTMKAAMSRGSVGTVVSARAVRFSRPLGDESMPIALIEEMAVGRAVFRENPERLTGLAARLLERQTDVCKEVVVSGQFAQRMSLPAAFNPDFDRSRNSGQDRWDKPRSSSQCRPAGKGRGIG